MGAKLLTFVLSVAIVMELSHAVHGVEESPAVGEPE